MKYYETGQRRTTIHHFTYSLKNCVTQFPAICVVTASEIICSAFETTDHILGMEKFFVLVISYLICESIPKIFQVIFLISCGYVCRQSWFYSFFLFFFFQFDNASSTASTEILVYCSYVTTLRYYKKYFNACPGKKFNKITILDTTAWI